jgi:hypothetical protein
MAFYALLRFITGKDPETYCAGITGTEQSVTERRKKANDLRKTIRGRPI